MCEIPYRLTFIDGGKYMGCAKSSCDRDATVAGRSGVLFSRIGDEIVLMSVETGKYYGLDPIGADIWQRMQSPVSVAALCAGLADTYDAPSDEISQDVTDLLERLLADGLIVLASEPVAA